MKTRQKRSPENDEGMPGRLGMTGHGAWWQSGQVVQVGCGTTITSTAPVQRLHLHPLSLIAASNLERLRLADERRGGGGGKGVVDLVPVFILPSFLLPHLSSLYFPFSFLPVL